jgi:hypothetical protein
LVFRQWPAARELVDVALSSRFEDAGLTDLVPRELAFDVHLSAEDASGAVAEAGAVVSALAALVSFAANAFVRPAAPYLAYESAPGLTRRRFWQREVPFQQGVPPPSRHLDDKLLFPLLSAVQMSPDGDRLGRAVSQYHVALSHWTTAGRPLALAHLYMALEALGPVAERTARQQLGLADEREHALHRSVDVTRSNWREVLLGWVRRDVLCQGDRATYDAARKASDGFEHGFMHIPTYRALAEQHGRALMDYVRAGLLEHLDLPQSVRADLVQRGVSSLTVRGVTMWHAGDASGAA